MKVERFIFGPFETNTYVVSDEQGNVLLIDPACYFDFEKQELEDYINSQTHKLSNKDAVPNVAILATHGHLDHLWGAKWATEKWNTPVLMHEADIPMAKAMQQQYDLFGVRRQAEDFPIENLQSSIFNLQSQMSNFELLETPGHTPGSICLYFPLANNHSPFAITGDTLFHMGYGRTDLPGGNMGQLINSLEHLFTLPSDTVVYPGHGDFTTIGAECR